MENSPEYQRTEQEQSDPNSAVPRSVSGLIRRLIGFFTLTNEERLKAGIIVGSQKHTE